MRTESYEHRAQERFWSKVDKSGGPDACWPWTAAANVGGYGVFGYLDGTVLAHRFALGVVDPTPGLDACHSCGNRLCCNPSHLRMGNRAENEKDKIMHGTICRGESRPLSKLTDVGVRSIRREYAAGDVTQRDLAARHGISQKLVWLIVHGKKWSHV